MGDSTLKEMKNGELEGENSGVAGGVEDMYGEDRATQDQPITPWAISVAR